MSTWRASRVLERRKEVGGCAEEGRGRRLLVRAARQRLLGQVELGLMRVRALRRLALELSDALPRRALAVGLARPGGVQLVLQRAREGYKHLEGSVAVAHQKGAEGEGGG